MPTGTDRSRPMSALAKLSALLVLVPVLVASCGIKGPLELPEEPSADAPASPRS
jgi:predicted small lipoprotein YifL